MLSINDLIFKACNNYLLENQRQAALDVNSAINNALSLYVEAPYLLDNNTLIWMACNKYLGETQSDTNTAIYAVASSYLLSRGKTVPGDINSAVRDALYIYLGMDAYLYLNFLSNTYRMDGKEYNNFTLVPGATSTGGAGFGTVQRNGVWQSVPANAPLIGDGGLGVWEARTNSIRNPVMAGSGGSKAGSGTVNGNVPNDFIVTAASGVTVNVSYTTIDGQTFLIAEVSGTPATSPHFEVFFTDAVSTPAASDGQTWTVQAGVALLAGSLSSVSAATLRGLMFDTGFLGSVISPDLKASISASVSTLRAQLVVNQAATQYFRPQIAFSGSGSPVSYTVAIGLPNLKLGPDINDPPILQTSGLAATRRAVAQSVGGLVLPSAFEVRGRFRIVAAPDAGTFRRVFSVNDGGTTNTADVYINGSRNIRLFARSSGVVVAEGGPASQLEIGRYYDLLARYKADAFSLYLDGVLVFEDTSGPMPVGLNRVQFGNNSEMIAQRTLNGEIANLSIREVA